MNREAIYTTFKDTFGIPDVSVFAPGRANIIGEHTDYNDGFVLPFAINHGVWFHARHNSSDKLSIIARDTGEQTVIDLIRPSNPVFGWDRFFIQVLQAMSGHSLKGADIVFGGDLPIGAGISSSSAITCGFVRVLDLLHDLGLSSEEIVNTAITAERGSGVRGGIMDQYTIVNGVKDKAILLDCRTNSHSFIDLELGQHRLYLINTRVKHNLVHTDYNNRRAQCEEAVSLLHQHYRPVKALRDLHVDELYKIEKLLPDTLFNRASFVIQENQRVLDAVEAIRLKNFAQLGELLYASHDGLSQMYDVSCEELDWLVNFTLDQDDFLGARMMGGGFGGCTINLTTKETDIAVLEEMAAKYSEKFGIRPEIIPISPEDGILQKK
ncbi:MAG: galactokinase [Saprospiraceae bacterium]|jgi:galactokinase|nr:galactokinase [Saprospiraceae bacterium]